MISNDAAYPNAHGLYMALRQLELELSKGKNLEFLRDRGNGNAITFIKEVCSHIGHMEGKKNAQ